jgi:ribosome assembly protein YihI (activator of Der GTPase)
LKNNANVVRSRITLKTARKTTREELNATAGKTTREKKLNAKRHNTQHTTHNQGQPTATSVRFDTPWLHI